jgi:tRNA-dihydrouridine synthase A
VTVKHRIGIDDQDSYELLAKFVSTVQSAGCQTFIVHARKAILSGLSPKENREIPPLCYEVVYQLKRDFPDLEILINGGITTISDCLVHLNHVDGVMLGREVYHNPYLLMSVDADIYGAEGGLLSRQEVVMKMLPYIRDFIGQGGRLNSVTRHMLGLFHGQSGARAWRRHLSEYASQRGADESVLLAALEFTL